MINENRIVPVTATDLLTLYGVMFAIAGTSIAKVDSTDPLGDFAITSGSGNLLASEPVRSFDFGSSVTSATLYFIPTYDYQGFTVAGEAATIVDNDVEVQRDGQTLYKAVLSDGSITITKVGF